MSPTLVGLEVGDPFTVTGLPSTAPATDVVVHRGRVGHVDDGSVAAHDQRFPGDDRAAWVLDSAVLSVPTLRPSRHYERTLEWPIRRRADVGGRRNRHGDAAQRHIRDNMTDLRTAKTQPGVCDRHAVVDDNTLRAITFGAETYDTDSWHSTGSERWNGSPPTLAGLYLVVGSLEVRLQILFGLRALRLPIGFRRRSGETAVGATASGAPMLSCSALYRANRLATTSRCTATKNSGGALNTSQQPRPRGFTSLG